jgi:hypothetical protein
MKCYVCEGKGGWQEDVGIDCVWWETCPHCKDGSISFWDWFTFKLWDQWLPTRFVEWYIDREFEKDKKKHPEDFV